MGLLSAAVAPGGHEYALCRRIVSILVDLSDLVCV